MISFRHDCEGGLSIIMILKSSESKEINRRRRCTFENGWRSALLSLLLWKEGTARQESLGAKHQEVGLPTFELQPTSVLALLRQRRRLLNSSRLSTEDIKDDDWFHPNANAIYATIPKKEDLSEFEGDELLEDFHQYRHLSRHERHFRQQNGIDLQLDWDGIYVFDDDNRTEDVRNSSKDATNDTRVQNSTKTGRELQRPSSHFGGRFNNYQAVALSQGYGTHYAHAWVGSPTPQRKTRKKKSVALIDVLLIDDRANYSSLSFPCNTVIVDTGSHFVSK